MGETAGKTSLNSLSTIQAERDEWVAHNFPLNTIEDSFTGMVEEMGELAHHLLKERQGIRSDGVDHEAEIEDACADLIIFMLGIAHHRGFVLDEVLNEVWASVKQRDWVKYPHDGRTI